MLKLRKGDMVKITSGKDKGKEGKIEKVFSEKQTAFVPGINVYKKHVKASMTADGKGGIFELSRPIDFAKISLICPNCKKQTRVGFVVKEGTKVRICKKCGKVI